MAVSISIEIKQNQRIAASNQSDVTVSVIANWTGGSHNQTQKPGWVKIDGVRYDFISSFNTGKTTSGSEVIYEMKNIKISHKSDGSKTLSCSASYTTGVSSGTVTASASKALVAISRKSTLSVNNGTLGSPQDLNIVRQSTSFTHSIKAVCGNTTFYINANGTTAENESIHSGINITFTPPISLASQSKDGLYVTVVFQVETYNGADSLGSTFETIRCYIPANTETNPTVSISVTDTTGCFSTYGNYVQNKSKLSILVTASGKQDSTIKSYETTIGNKVYTSQNITTDVLPNSGDITIKTTVIDSRGRKAVASRTITVLEYSPPKITDLNVYRGDLTGGANSTGDYLNVKFSAKAYELKKTNTDGTTVIQNAIAYKIKYRKFGTTNYTEIPLNSAKNEFNIENWSFPFKADTSSSYDIVLEATDNFGTVEVITTGQTATKTWSMLGKGLGFAFGKIAEVINALDVAWNLIARRNIYMGYYHDNEKNIFFKNHAAHTSKTYAANALYPHNCKVYGGNANSTTAIGFYDTRKKKGVLVYDDHNDFIKTQTNIRQHVFQAYQKEATSITANGWNKIKLGDSTDEGLNPTLDNNSTTRFFELTTDGGVKCNCNGYVMVSGQLYMNSLSSTDIAGACISHERITQKDGKDVTTNTNLAWNYVRHEVASAYVPIMPLVVSVQSGDVFFLNGRNFGKTSGAAPVEGSSAQTTRLVIQYVG